MNRNFTRWGLSQLVAIFMLVIAGSAFAAPGDQLTHNSNNLGTKYGVWGTVGGKYGEITCATCHNSTTTNVKRVKQTITATLGSWSSSKTPGVPVVFNNMTAFGTDAAAHTTTSTAVCQVCHSKTTVHRYNKPVAQTDLNHQNYNQKDCTDCHSHAAAFKPTCNTCHGFPPDNATPGPGGQASPATNALPAGQKGSHVAHDVFGMSCNTCHTGYDPNHMTVDPKKIQLGFRVKTANVPTWKNYSVTTGTYTGQTNANMAANGYTWQATSTGTTITQVANSSTCSIYCHGNWTGANGAGVNPSWTAAPGVEKACGACHGASPGATPTTPGHVRHAGNAAGGIAKDCSLCHGAHPDNSHVTGSVKWAFDGLSTSLKGSPRYKGALSGETLTLAPSTTFGNCSNLYCHSNVQNVNNGTGKPSSYASVTWSNTLLNCGSCHMGQGAGFSLISSGSHRAHVSRGYTYNCNTCHTGAGDQAANHADGLIQVSIPGGGTYSQAGQASGNGYGTCSSTSCHTDGNGIPSTPQWGTPNAVGCSYCHGTSNAFGRPDTGTPNSHTVHAASGADCYKCHRLTASKTAGKLVTGTADHLDATIDARLAKIDAALTNFSGAYKADKTCQATYCHGGLVTTVAWGTTGPLACTACHASDNTLPGAHSLHVNATAVTSYLTAAANTSSATVTNFTCASCHGNTAANHINYPVVNNSDATIFFGFSSAGKNPAYSRTGTVGTDARGFKWMYGANAACNATYCHSNGRGGAGALATYTWNTTTTGPCNSCHGNEANAATLSGSHNKHVTSAMFGGATLMKCKDCHAPVISNIDNRTLANKAKHVNKFMDYSGRYAGKNKNCNNIYCHSNGKGSFNNPTWVGTNAVGCAFCHATSGLLTGSHNAHITSPNMVVTCKYCHNNTTNNDTTITGAQHIDGTVNIVAGTSLNYGLVPKAVSFTPSGTTCNNISCHSAYTVISNTATWGATGTCETCHPKGNLSVGHLVHIGALDFTQSNNPAARIFYNMTANRSPNTNDTVKRHGFGCATCHPLTETNHLNGAVEIDLASKNVANTGKLRFLNSTTATKLPSINGSKQCMNIYCHSNASRVPAELTFTLTPAWGGSFGAGDRCAKCHLNQPKTGAHGAHAVGNHTFNNATSVAGSNMLDGNIFNGKTGKVLIANRKNTAHGNPDNSTTISCNICHKTTMNNPQNDQNYKCRQCHVSGSNGGLVKGNASISSLKSHVNGNREVTFDPIFVKSKAQVRPKGASANNSGFDFYSGVWKRNTYKNNSTLSYDTSKVRLDIATTYTLSTPQNSFCSNVVCHNGGSPKWNLTDYNDPNKCMDCHSKL